MRLKISSLGKLVAATILAASALPVLAQSAGDTVLSVGWFRIAPQDSSDALQVVSPIQQTLRGSGSTVEKSDTLGFSLNHFLTDNWALTLDLGVPPTYKLDGTGTLASVGRLGSAKQWAPTVLVKYYFGDANTQFRPLVGLGVSRVWYTNIELTSNFQRSIGALFSDPTASSSADIDSSWAPVILVGGSYAINKDWYAGLTVSYLKMKADATVTTKTNTLGTVTSKSHVDVNPLVTFLNIGYRF